MSRTLERERGVAEACPAMPDVLTALADGCLTRAEVDAVVAWLRATAVEPPPSLVDRAVRIAQRGDRAPG